MKVGDLAYYDSFLGLLPCKVLSIDGAFTKVRFTSKRTKHAYKFGTEEFYPSYRIVARKDVFYRNGIAHIRSTESRLASSAT